MRKKIIIIWLFAIFPILVYSQSSGGQIKRPTKVMSSKQSKQSNGNTKKNPIVDIRPRTIPVSRTSIVGYLPWTLLSVEILDNCTKLYWSVCSLENSQIFYNNILIKDSKTNKKFSVLKAEGVSIRNNKVELKKNSPTIFTLVFSALPKGTSSIDIYEDSLPILGNINVSSKDAL